MKVEAYNPENVVLLCGGNIIKDFAKETFIEVDMAEQQFTYEPGLSTGVRIYNPSRWGTINVTLMQGSPSNIVFENFLRTDMNNGEGFFVLTINDNNAKLGITSWLCRAPVCWVQRHAPWSYGVGHTTRTWVLETGSLDYRPQAGYRELSDEAALGA